MKITEGQLRDTISKVIRENYLNEYVESNSPFAAVDQEARTKAVEIENEIEAMTNQVKVLMSVGQILNGVDKEIKNQFQGIQGPVKESYYYVYKFVQPLQYNEETDMYGNYDGYIDNDVKEMFPDEIKDAVNVYSIEKNNFFYGFEISIDLDDIKGWY